MKLTPVAGKIYRDTDVNIFMIFATFNAPAEAFENSSQLLMQGKSVEDLFLIRYRELSCTSDNNICL